jgi:DNA-binding transcriptional regulator YhcF (GntR family)
VTLWAWIGPGVVATAREIVEWTIASGPDQQDAVIAVAIGAVLIAWWIRWAARRRIASSLIARTASDHAVAALVGPGRVDERVARHEAAPAVVASALGAKVLRVRAIPDGTAGRCEWAFDVPGQSAVENAWVTLCALAAGEVEVPEGPAAWPGASSDTHEALADLWDVSLNTVRGAQSTLAAEGLLVAVQGVGVFVADVLPSRDPLEVAQRELQVALREHEEASRRLADAVRAVDAALPGSAVRA